MASIRIAALALLAAGAALGLAAMPASAGTLKVSVDGLKNGGVISHQYAFCVPAAQGHTAPGPNISPRISWSKGPAGTQSYAIVLSDTDVPTIRDNMNKEGVTVAASMKRRTFYHWVLVDIPANVTSLAKGAESDARVAHGKPATPTKAGVRGLNDYTKVLAGNPAMKGQYFGYDGPCPPWNDEIVHHYHFTVYALSVPTLNLGTGFDGAAAMAAIQGLVLAQGELNGLYAQNPAVIAKLPK
jgi:Raf kinase inhibitor-like YbhB/YbcL family protein